MTTIVNLIQSKETNGFRLDTNREFYRKIAITSKRFGKLLRGEADPTLGELRRIAEFFGVSMNELISE
jgi:transcriptional regulator with XRE-family HTH domain